MRIKPNFNAQQAIEYARNGGRLYLNGWEYWYDEKMVLEGKSPILTSRHDDMPFFSARNIWEDLENVEIDCSPSISGLSAIEEVRAMERHIENLKEIVQHMIK